MRTLFPIVFISFSCSAANVATSNDFSLFVRPAESSVEGLSAVADDIAIVILGKDETAAADCFLDVAIGPRTNEVVRPLAYSSKWFAGADGVKVFRNGEEMFEGAGEGAVNWAPTANGTYEFVCQARAGSSSSGTPLRATFVFTSFSEVKSVSAQQRYPWNGLVDISLTFDGEENRDYRISFSAKDLEGNQTLPVSSLVHPVSGAKGPVFTLRPGAHHFIWDANADIADHSVFNRVVMQVDVEEVAK